MPDLIFTTAFYCLLQIISFVFYTSELNKKQEQRNFTDLCFKLKGETKKLPKLLQQFLLNFSGYKHDRQLGHNLI